MAVLLALLGTAWAAPKAPVCAPDAETAVKLARTRGKLIFLTVIIDGDGENRAVIDELFRDREFLKISKEFVCLYANKDNDHGAVRVRTPKGTKEVRCADCPSIRCDQHMILAMNYARGFFPTSECRTPVHFVIDAKEEVVDTIKNGTFEQGFSHVPAKQVVAKLKALLKKHGRGLTEEEYKRMQGLLTDARAARARGNTTLELEKLLAVVALQREVEGVQQARARIKEIDALASRELAAVDRRIDAREWEEALDALQRISETYPGTLTCATAEKRRAELQELKPVKRLLKAGELYERATKYLERKKLELARKYFEKCVRLYSETRYATLAREALATLDREPE